MREMGYSSINEMYEATGGYGPMPEMYSATPVPATAKPTIKPTPYSTMKAAPYMPTNSQETPGFLSLGAMTAIVFVANYTVVMRQRRKIRGAGKD